MHLCIRAYLIKCGICGVQSYEMLSNLLVSILADGLGENYQKVNCISHAIKIAVTL